MLSPTSLTPVKAPRSGLLQCKQRMTMETLTMHQIEVDARGQEPPQPLVIILEALANLPPRTELLALTDRRPLHLYAQLELRGFIGVTRQLPDGSYQTRIQSLSDQSPRQIPLPWSESSHDCAR